MIFNPSKFSFVGFIPEATLEKVPSKNTIVNEYHKLPTSGVRLMSDELRKALDEASKLKSAGKRKVKAAPSEVLKTPKKVKNTTQKPRSPSPVAQ